MDYQLCLMFGVRLVSKLRAIFLMEADFNAMNKEVYGVRMLEEARKYKLIPEEIFSKRIAWQTTAVLQKHSFTTLYGRPNLLWQLPLLMHPTVIIELHMQWLH
jgi:hypothetical protein